MYLRKLRKKIAMILAAGSVAGAVFAPSWMPRAEAFGLWDVVGGVIGTAQAYGAWFNAYIEAASFISNQNETLIQEIQRTGELSNNPKEIALVDDVMNQLLDRGKYSVDARSLPFKWNVFQSNTVNACCYYNNLICVYHGVIAEMHYDRDMMAGILAHEMTHGIKHHTQKSVAEANAKAYGLNWLSQYYNPGNLQNFVQALYNYDIAKNTILPNEYEADEEGFYLAASAGFNPGGMPATLAGLWRVSNYKTHADFADFTSPNDHPDSDKRLDKACKLLTEYSYNHVKIVDRTKVYVDDTLIYDTQPEGEYPAMEKACLVAGGLAKEFHDKRLGSMWPFERDANGKVSYAPIGDAKKWAKAAIHEAGNAELLEKLVTAAYSADSKSGIREELYEKELNRLQEYAERTERLSDLDQTYAARKLENSAAYLSLGHPRQAEFEANCALANSDELKNPGISQAHALKGLVRMDQKDLGNAEKEMDLALSADPHNVLALTGRASLLCEKGDNQKALEACQQALQMRANNAFVYSLQGRVYDRMGNEAKALESFQRAQQIDVNTSIPGKYAAMLSGEIAPETQVPEAAEEVEE